MGNVTAAVTVMPQSRLEISDWQSAAGARVVALRIDDDLSLVFAGWQGDGAVVIAADNVIRSLQTIRNSALARLAQTGVADPGPVLVGRP